MVLKVTIVDSVYALVVGNAFMMFLVEHSSALMYSRDFSLHFMCLWMLLNHSPHAYVFASVSNAPGAGIAQRLTEWGAAVRRRPYRHAREDQCGSA